MRLINLKSLRNRKTKTKKERKTLTFEKANRLLKERQKILNGFEGAIFPKERQTQGKRRPGK